MMFLFAVLFVRAMAYGPRSLQRPAAPTAVDAGGAGVETGLVADVGTTGAARPEEVVAVAPPSKAPSVGDAGHRASEGQGSAPEAGDAGVEESLVARLKGQVVPSLLMCMQERVGRGDSFDGEVSFKVRLKPDEGEPGHASVELVSVDGADMKKADYDCIWPNFEDVSLELGSQAGAFADREEIEAEFGIVLSLKGAER